MYRRACSSDRRYGSIILYLKAQNWVSLLIHLWCAILLHGRNALRNPLFISPILSVTQCYLKANSLSSWAVLQPRLHSHQASLELLSAAKLKLLVETSTQVDKNTITLLTHHQSTIYPKTKTLQDCTCWGCASPLFIFHRTSDKASTLHLTWELMLSHCSTIPSVSVSAPHCNFSGRKGLQSSRRNKEN